MEVISFIIKSGFEYGGEANGYVAVPPNHPLHGVQFWDIEKEYDIKVHNGITYSRSANEPYGITVGEDLDVPDDYWILGFHTQGDDDTKKNWNLQNVLKELRVFKNQIEAIQNTNY